MPTTFITKQHFFLDFTIHFMSSFNPRLSIIWTLLIVYQAMDLTTPTSLVSNWRSKCMKLKTFDTRLFLVSPAWGFMYMLGITQIRAVPLKRPRADGKETDNPEVKVGNKFWLRNNLRYWLELRKTRHGICHFSIWMWSITSVEAP